MKNAAIWILACVMLFSACGNQEDAEPAVSPAEETESHFSETFPAETVNASIPFDSNAENASGSETLQQIKEQFGLPFRLHGPVDQGLRTVYIYDSHATREVITKTDDNTIIQDDLNWGISDTELTISGQWNESFRIDLEAMTAVSELDGTVYFIASE